MRLWRRSGGDGAASTRWIVGGLGNPGDRYARTRHNVGAMVLEVLCRRMAVKLKPHKTGCLVAEANLAGTAVVLARPMAYMNESGRPLGGLVRWYKTPVGRVVVAHDELDLAFGELRVKTGGGTAGHNGLKSLVAHLGSNDFIRVRVGIGRPRGMQAPEDYVLEPFSAAERGELPLVLERAADAAEAVVSSGAERAMNEFNTRS